MSVDGVDDPANHVDTPVVSSPTPLPSGDPAIVALIGGIGHGLGQLPSWVATVSVDEAGFTMTETVTIDNRPVHAARIVIETPAAGFTSMGILLIGKDAWSRDGTGPWKKAAKGDFPTCGQNPSFSGGTGSMPACTFATLSDVSADLRAIAGTFTEVSPDEIVSGVHAVHLRSTAGMSASGLTVPGQTDVWIAIDGGWLMRDTFAGQGFSVTVDIGGIGDAANVLTPPTR
jgi:hypothetical protein